MGLANISHTSTQQITTIRFILSFEILFLCTLPHLHSLQYFFMIRSTSALYSLES
ncbi:hypothetical protein HFN_0192 [Helicobacter fennelliae MRY12-0050]|uniref:Uncharacterized protein n=1 Tax=Helicobacter fennelliae MRY12-0050 TaxID=1325130 RepID=T1D1H2_9HELI|nr:hypothetical protein HFN_0192 [Helicobacter fennelliae MRY12-0050]